MSCFKIIGGKRLSGEIEVCAAKNSALVLLAASLLVQGEVIIHKLPDIVDISYMLKILEALGSKVKFDGRTVVLDNTDIISYEPHKEYSKKLRSSIFLLGALLGRQKKAVMVYPGGCEIGLRPIDLHLNGLKKLGVDVLERGGYIYCDSTLATSGSVHLDIPSVGATENLILASVLIDGVTEINNAAKEPEVVSLADFLNAAGAKVYGAGTSIVRIEGVKKLSGVEITPIPDRIIAGTYMIAAAITNGDLLVKNCDPKHLIAVSDKLASSCDISVYEHSVRVKGYSRPNSIDLIKTMPYPAFPTDLQAPIMALQTISKGNSVIIENMFETRFKQVNELLKMGANIIVNDRAAFVIGREKLIGCEVKAEDLRGGASLVLAGLRAEGVTTVTDVLHIDRGYFRLDKELNSVGADITRVE
ncbi:MAG: UDP-N-acetylglucosamine 1-carboxyvinyltransferase [Clostridia bacterium]|nr:UDP-N-acetylglucosamine 1-carboxyvinyltransferase [Clostridia bacterium]